MPGLASRTCAFVSNPFPSSGLFGVAVKILGAHVILWQDCMFWYIPFAVYQDVLCFL